MTQFNLLLIEVSSPPGWALYPGGLGFPLAVGKLRWNTEIEEHRSPLSVPAYGARAQVLCRLNRQVAGTQSCAATESFHPSPGSWGLELLITELAVGVHVAAWPMQGPRRTDFQGLGEELA